MSIEIKTKYPNSTDGGSCSGNADTIAIKQTWSFFSNAFAACTRSFASACKEVVI